ncbi:CENP-B homolog protein 2-like [Rhizophagus clarus]|uniref:CENP-B homolog protein 2-like n=1 Tax=Rhizophagus clarus TaxID=94130 RepID=A0A8H3L2N9_9GLOM|nr:CENP-B homolog protein 2-like [Rhizophagus clarus]
MPKTKSALNKYSQAKGKDKMRTLPKIASLTIAQKHEICYKKINEPYIKNKELAELYNVSEGCISDTLKKSQKWLEIDPQAPEAQGKRQNKLNFPEIEEALTLWVLKALENGVDISDQVLHEKAIAFASLYKVENFKGSNGWIGEFKKRHNLSCYLKQGEAASAPLDKLDEFRKNLQDLIRNYSLEDVFNCDETGLYWKMEPKRTISNKPVSGKKQSKDRVTILLCSNATGTEKLKPVFIHKYKNPRPLKNLSKTSLPVEYYWNSTAWMQVSIWNDWIRKFDAQMRLKGRNILLLIDNAPVHALYEGVELTNIKIEFLPPNTTAHLQPCDKGIINSFKAQYRKLLLQNRIKAFDFQQLTGNSKSPINIKKAIKYVVSAWDRVLPKTIFNCWNKPGILPDDTNSYNEIEENRHNETEENEYREIQDLINKLEYTHPLTAEEYIRLDQENEIAGIPPSEEQIVAILKENNTMSDDEGDKDIISVTSSEALIAFDTIFNYVEQNDSQDIFDKSALKVMKKIRKIVYRNNFFSKKQSSLDLFVIDKGSKLKPNNTAIDPVDNNTMNREREGDNNIIDIENFDFEALYFNEFDFYNYEEDQGFIEYQIDENSLYK